MLKTKVVLRLLNFLCVLLSVTLIASLCATSLALAQDSSSSSYPIAEVIVDGTRRIDPESLKVNIEASAGLVTQEVISKDVKSLYGTGFFDQVNAILLSSPTDQTKKILKYSLQEKPLVRRVLIDGNEEIDDDDLLEILNVGSRRFMDKSQIKALIENAVSHYQAQGFYDATIDYKVIPVADNQVDVSFEVKEGEKYKIREVKIRGVNKVDQDDLLDTMETSRYKWWSSWLFSTGRLNKIILDNDRRLLRQYFLDHGFVDAVVNEPLIEFKSDGIYITIFVKEGAQYKIGKISVSGDLIESDPEKTLEEIETESGEVFSAATLRKDTFKISEKFTDIGYAYANVVPNTQVNRGKTEVDLDFNIDQGKLVTVDRIYIRGNDKTYDNVIRRELTIAEQELYSSSKLNRSQVLLQRLGFFEEVNIATEEGDSDDTIDLKVNVREGSTGTLSAGAGYSSSDGALFNTRISENNVLGTGRSIRANIDVGSRRNNTVISIEDPRINDSKWSASIDLINTDREFTDFDRSQIGGGAGLGYPLGDFFGEWAQDIRFALRYQFLEIEIDEVDEEDAAQLVIDEQGKSTTSAFTPRLIRNTIDNPLNPSSGSRQVISVEGAGLGGSEEYYIIEAVNQLYHPLFDTSFGSFVFSWRTRFGFGDTLNGDTLPLFKRYFPGGINSVRGYKNRTLGPRDSDGNEFGGSKQLINNLEIIFPLIESAGLRGVAFYDIGEAFDDRESIHVSDLRQAWGYGVRWTSPLGPIRIEFGFPIDQEAGEDSMVTLFSFGAPL